MPPRSENEYVSTLGYKIPKHRNAPFRCGDLWLDDRRDADGAEGLWRVHDGLYDLTSFIKKHPGGPQWLELSKGTDITEAFEVHHLSEKPLEVIKNYYVRDAKTKRNSPFTFNDDGFYKTLKREIVKEYDKLPKQTTKYTDLMADGLLIATFIFSLLAARYWSYWLAALAGYCLNSLVVAGHNYFHRKDNWRMYYFSFSLMQVREWRITHVLSHHLHTNTIIDLEISNLEPFLKYLPIQQKPLQRYGAILMFPIYALFSYHRNFINRYMQVVKGQTNHLGISELVPFALPVFMYLFAGQSILHVLWMWNVIVMLGSLCFESVGLNAAHHHPDIFHDGDTPRASGIDWGIGQLDAIIDRCDVTGNPYLVLTTFGDHALHHMFPTLDHALLDFIYPIFNRVLKDFNIDLRMKSQLEMIKGQFRQLIRIEPNPNPPDLLKCD